MRCTELTTSMPLLRIQHQGATSSTIRGGLGSWGTHADAGVLITPTDEGANVIAGAFDVTNVHVERQINVCAELHDGAPTREFSDEWQSVAEVDIDATGPLEITDCFGRRLDAPSEAVSGAVGLHRVRVAARGRSSMKPTVQIDAWPVTEPSRLVQLRHTDGVDMSQFGSQPEPVEEVQAMPPRERMVTSTAYLSPTEPTTVDAEWTDLVRVLADRGIHELSESLAAASVVDETTSEGSSESSEVEVWFRLVDALDLQGRRSVLPGVDLLPEASALAIQNAMLEAWASEDDEIPPMTAAVTAHRFRPEFVAVAERDSYILVVDTRQGRFHGCVTAFDKVGADEAGPSFRSISAMLRDLTEAVRNGSTFLGAQPVFDDGHLVWDAGFAEY